MAQSTQAGFLPISMQDMLDRGWEQPDFVLITGDAYVDHPSFGAAVIGRVLERAGFKIGIIAQPKWQDVNAFKALGKPRLGFLITAGNIDSMVNHYTTALRKRSDDLYSPGGKGGYRPDRASIVYSQMVRQAYGKVPIIFGGLESSLRRFAHYDYWSDSVRKSILIESGGDLIVYGMGERPIVEVAQALESGLPIYEITFVRGTVYKTHDKSRPYQPIILPDYEEIAKSKSTYAQSFMVQYR
ncbi:MAG TPA: YgiQ family radical SAM protein, partial [Oscillospiraceae bacterium]|nr:YgiQ family radical SAM protein [Oscillospiraceae bacterium]